MLDSNPHDNIHITGVGLTTPLGASAILTWDALLAGRAILDHAPVPGLHPENRACELARRVGREAIQQAGWSSEILRDDATALIIATSKGPVETWLTNPAGGIDGFGLAQIAADIASFLGLGMGSRLTLSAACASGLHGLIRAAMMIQTGEISRALVIATEASLHPLFIGSFSRLGVLAPQGYGCRPFDEQRRGFIISEAAAAVCLESPQPSPASALAHLARYALGGDAAHLTSGDPRGQTLRRLLRQVIQGRPIDLIHAHGTGTILNDPMELAALESEIAEGESPAWVYSHKAALGHSLGASGLVSVVLNCMAHQRQIAPGNVHTNHPLAGKSLSISRENRKVRIRQSLAIASGFGGAMAVVGMSSS